MNMLSDRVALRTVIPGPLTRLALEKQREIESSAVSYPRRLPLAISRASGSYLEDLDGNVYADFLTGAGSLPLGHCHPEVVAAAHAQLSRHCHGLDFPSEAKQQFSEIVIEMLPESLRREMKIHFCGPTGADAVEAALKLCKLVTGGDEIISFQGGYHGCTTGAMSVTGLRSVKEHVGNRMPGVHFFPYSNCTNCPIGLSGDSCETNCIEFLERALDDPNSGLGRPSAALLELVQGEGGVIPARREFVHRLRETTRRHRIPLIVDEIQTGCGRTGSWFAFEQYDIEPDVLVVSKGLSGLGLPVSLMIYRREMDKWSAGAHIGTFRGNQIAFAAGVAAAQVMRRDMVLDNVRERSRQLLNGLEALQAEFPLVCNVRGRGLMLGFDLRDDETKALSPVLATKLQTLAFQRGLILEVGGRNDITVRLLPPLNVSQESCCEALEILRAAATDLRDWRATHGHHLQYDYSI